MKKNVHAPTYRSWQMMKNRCLNPNATDYAHYGGRGITVHADWLTYESFLADMGERPGGKTLERENGNDGYHPANCVWATKTEQSRNREYTRNVSYAGRTQKVWEWASELKLKPRSFHCRLWWFKQGAITESQMFAPNPRAKI